MPSIRPPLRPAIRAPLRPPLAPALGGSPSLTAQVQALFAGGKVGGMWDMGDTATLFQDAAGATPVTAVTQPIGRVNDKSGNGNHATQPTAGSRPLFSARKNLLVKSEDFADAVWSTASSSLGAATVFSSGNVANLVLDTAANDQHTRITNLSTAAGAVTVSFKVRKKDLDYVVFRAVQDGILCYFNVSSGTTGAISGAAITSMSASGADFVCVVQFVTAGDMQLHFGVTPADATLAYVGSGVGNYIGEPQVETGSTATRYQRVNTASDYDTVGFPAFAQFDGTDDELFTGALTPNSDMDCFIAIYRNSAARSVVAYDQLTGGFCVMDSGDAASTATFGIPATNTYAVDGVSVAGGTGTTRAQLASAVSPGAWHIIEARNLNLSSFSPLRVGNYGPTWPLEGKIGGIVLISALSTADRNLVRTYLGSKVGLTL